MRSCHRGKQVRRERRNAALARQVIADKRDLANFGTFFHKAVFHSSRPALLCTRVCARQLQMCRLSVKWEGAFSGSVDSVLRAVVFKACGSTDPMRVGRSAGRIFAQMQWSSRRAYQAIPRHGCIPAVRYQTKGLDNQARNRLPAAVSPGKIIVPRIVIGGVIFEQPAGGGIGDASVYKLTFLDPKKGNY